MPTRRRYFASVQLSPDSMGTEAGTIGEEVVAHLSGLEGADVRVTIEIQATRPKGFPEQVVRVVEANSDTLRFREYGFEEE